MSDSSVGFVDQSGGKSTFEIDFGALKAQASEMIDKLGSTPEATPEPAQPATPAATEVRVKGATTGQGSATEAPKAEVPAVEVPAQPDEVVDTSTATPQQLADLKDDSVVSFPVDGEEQVMTWKEAKAGFSRHAKFTKGMQQLAKDRQEVTAVQSRAQQLETERVGLENFLRNPNAILNYVVKEFGPQALAALTGAQPQAQVGRNPDEIVTAAEAQQIAGAERAAVEAKLQNVLENVEKRIAATKQEIEFTQQQAKHAVAITSTLSDIFTTSPVLKTIPHVEDLIRYEVAQMQPQTEAEALDAFRSVAAGMIEGFSKHQVAAKKIAKVAEVKAKLESKSIEPPGGSSPQLQPTTYKNADGSVNWNTVRDMALNFGK